MYVDLHFCPCSCCVSCIIFFFATTQLHSNKINKNKKKINLHKLLNFWYCCCCSCVIMLLFFICHCESTITYEEEQNDIVTTRTAKTTTTTKRFIYINHEIFLFTLVLLLLCHVVVFLVQLKLLIHNERWTRRITTFNSNNNKKGEGIYICLSDAFSIVCTEETCKSSSLKVVCWCSNIV